jgi:NADH dehydrogenase
MMTGANGKLVTVFGGSGFVGRHVVRALVKRGYRVRAAVRRPDLAGHLQPLGVVGQVHAMQANLRYPQSVLRAVEGSDAVVNLVGILQEQGRQTFGAVQAEGARAIADAARAAGVRAVVHMSAIGADAASASVYARTKAAGEAAMLAIRPDAIIMRASIVFGPEDQFFNRFAALARIMPVLPLVGGGETKFQPVHVGDVAEAIARAVDGGLKPGTVYELGGPEAKSFRELLEYVCEVTGRKRLLATLPFGLASLQAGALEFVDKLTFGLLPDAIKMTRDQVTLLRSDNVVSDAARAEGRTLEGMGIAPASIEGVVPSYLWRFRKSGQFEHARPS